MFPMTQQAKAESITAALASAYRANPQLNAQRAATRAVDEGVARAKSGYRPQITGDADFGRTSTSTNSPTGGGSFNPYGYGITIVQPLFDGFQTLNNVAAAKAQVGASRQQLRNTEQIV
ncbi:MAG: TolC family protein, partial [Pseudomonadota bacterium]